MFRLLADLSALETLFSEEALTSRPEISKATLWATLAVLNQCFYRQSLDSPSLAFTEISEIATFVDKTVVMERNKH